MPFEPPIQTSSATERPSTTYAVGAMAMCVALLIASEFMPVSLLTPIAADLGITEGLAGQAISVSGLFAVATSLLIAPIAGRFERRSVLVALTGFMMASLVLVALAPSFALLMAGRALLGVTIGGFWALSTATIMRMVPAKAVPGALGMVYMGNAVATAVAAPIGSYLGGMVGWRMVFWILLPLVAANIAWQWRSLPEMPPQRAGSSIGVLGLLKRRNVALAMAAIMLTFGGAFSSFTYFRPFLENYTHADVPHLSMLLLALGAAGFAGTYGATALLKRGHLYRMLALLPLALGAITLLLLQAGSSFAATAVVLVAWGAVNAAIPVAWSTWLARDVSDAPEAAGGLMVAAIQLAITAGAGLGGVLLDHVGIPATFIGGAFLLFLSASTVGRGNRVAAS
jgi:predicted MFS family arabinose efflux permease